jgi:NAD-dependent dihydropyrimidine dehydrogenase PreA subunit
VHCLTITPDQPDGDEAALRARLTVPALNTKQDIYVSAALPHTQRVMVKDEDLCVHCGLCAERCPTAAWDMQKFDLQTPYAGKPVIGLGGKGTLTTSTPLIAPPKAPPAPVAAAPKTPSLPTV